MAAGCRGALASLMGLALAGPAAAQQAGDIAAGRHLAETWCSNCHVVGPQESGPAADAAPTFSSIARMPSTTEMSLRAFLRTPHARMPDYHLSPAELDDLVAYILSLRGR